MNTPYKDEPKNHELVADGQYPLRGRAQMVNPQSSTHVTFLVGVSRVFRVFLLIIMLGEPLVTPCFAEFDNTNVLIEAAVNHMYQKRYKQAHQILKEAFENSPRHPGVHFNLARLFEMTGNFAEALKEYQMTASLDPSMVAARRGLARCSVELKRDKASPAQTVERAYEVPAEPRKMATAPMVSQQSSGRLPPPNSLGLPGEIITTSDVSREIRPQVSPPVLPPNRPTQMANASSQGRQPYLAPPLPSTANNQIMELPPMPGNAQLPAAHEIRVPPLPVEVSQRGRKRVQTPAILKAESLLDRGDASNAIESLLSTEGDSDNPDVHFLLARAFSSKGEMFASIKHLEETLRADEAYHEAYYLLAQNYARVNLLDDALKNYLAYFAVKPQAGVAVEIAKVYERMGKSEQAREYYSKANAMNPGNPNVQSRLSHSEGKTAEDLYLRANHSLTMNDFSGAMNLYQQALSMGNLDAGYQRDAMRKLEIAKLRANELETREKPAREGLTETRKIYGTVNLRYNQLAGIDFRTRFTGPVTVEWEGYIARSFKRYGRDFLLMIKELNQDELDETHRDQNDFRLNPNFNNQPLFLLTAPQGGFPNFVKEGAKITFTGSTEWKRYDIINDLGQVVKLPALEFISGHP